MAISSNVNVSTMKMASANAPAITGRTGDLASAGDSALSCISPDVTIILTHIDAIPALLSGKAQWLSHARRYPQDTATTDQRQQCPTSGRRPTHIALMGSAPTRRRKLAGTNSGPRATAIGSFLVLTTSIGAP